MALPGSQVSWIAGGVLLGSLALPGLALAYTSGQGFGEISFGYPSTFYPSDVQNAVNAAVSHGSFHTEFRFATGMGVYWPLARDLYLGPALRFSGDQVVSDGYSYRGDVTLSLIRTFAWETSHAWALCANLGPSVIGETGSISNVGIDVGGIVSLGAQYRLADDFSVTADYSLHQGSNLYQTVTVGLSLMLFNFKASSSSSYGGSHWLQPGDQLHPENYDNSKKTEPPP